MKRAKETERISNGISIAFLLLLLTGVYIAAGNIRYTRIGYEPPNEKTPRADLVATFAAQFLGAGALPTETPTPASTLTPIPKKTK